MDYDKLLNSSLEDIKKGYINENEYFECLFCSFKTEKGLIYKKDEVFYEAEKFMKLHIELNHSSVFETLIKLDKKVTGLSEHQNKILSLFYLGKNDSEIQEELGVGSSSTVRNHRFVLKEKERQAKIFLTLMELLKENNVKKVPTLVAPHKTAKMVDDRYKVTEKEREDILARYFPSGLGGKLTTFAMKEKSKIVVLAQLTKRFESNTIYSEKQVNEIIKTAFDDFSTIRRYFIEYGFMDRKPDGSEYWLKKPYRETEDNEMDRKKELKQLYKEIKTEAGVYQIRNNQNQKILIVTTPNLKTITGRSLELKSGSYKANTELQQELTKFGPEAFSFEILEVLEEPDEGFFDRGDELKKLEKKWLEKLQPYGEKGYHKRK